jgi:hypothetical protein
MSMKATVLILLLLAAPALTLRASAPPPERPPEREVRALMAAGAYAELPPRVVRWKVRLSAAERKRVLVLLLRRLGSARRLRLADTAKVVVAPRGRGPAPPAEGRAVLPQDVGTEGGRAAWAVEQLLGCELPFLPPDAEGAARARLVEAAYTRVFEAMLLPLPLLDAPSRAALAASPATDPDVLVKLATDPDATVRRAVAANLRLPRPVVYKMRDDPDEEVRRAARKNWVTARPVIGR